MQAFRLIKNDFIKHIKWLQIHIRYYLYLVFELTINGIFLIMNKYRNLKPFLQIVCKSIQPLLYIQKRIHILKYLKVQTSFVSSLQFLKF